MGSREQAPKRGGTWDAGVYVRTHTRVHFTGTIRTTFRKITRDTLLNFGTSLPHTRLLCLSTNSDPDVYILSSDSCVYLLCHILDNPASLSFPGNILISRNFHCVRMRQSTSSPPSLLQAEINFREGKMWRDLPRANCRLLNDFLLRASFAPVI